MPAWSPGETAFAAFSLNAFLINALPSGMPLNDLLGEAAVALDFAMTQKNRTSVLMALAQRQIARALTGATSRPDVFDDQEFVEAHFLEEAGRHETALGHFWVAKLQTAYLVGDYESAVKCSREAERRILKGILGMITSAEHVFYTALATAAAADFVSQRALVVTGSIAYPARQAGQLGRALSPELRAQGVAYRSRDCKAGSKAWRGVDFIPGRDR